MKRHLEPVDMMVAVGVFATVIGAYALFWSTSAALPQIASDSSTVAETMGPVTEAGTWVQPALGQAIVEEAVTVWDGRRAITRAARGLNDATMADHRLKAAHAGLADRISAYAASVVADHLARVQFVLGRSVANFTARGVRSGALTPETMGGDYNRVMIAVTESTGYQMNEAFQEAWQSRLGGLIVAADQDYLDSRDLGQERIGRSIVEVARVQDFYQTRVEGMQEQLASAALAALDMGQGAVATVRSASFRAGSESSAVPATRPRAWPELPVGVLFAASVALLGVFLMGVSLSQSRPIRRARPSETEAAPPSYRKTA